MQRVVSNIEKRDPFMRIPDLAPINFLGIDCPSLRAVGWLERGQHFPNGDVGCDVYEKLMGFRTNPWQPCVAIGFHECDLCLYAGEARGCNNLFIPGKGLLFVCPELIVHYMNAHEYAPPAEFCRAVRDCPPMRSMKYLKAILACGGGPLVRIADPKRGHGGYE